LTDRGPVPPPATGSCCTPHRRGSASRDRALDRRIRTDPSCRKRHAAMGQMSRSANSVPSFMRPTSTGSPSIISRLRPPARTLAPSVATYQSPRRNRSPAPCGSGEFAFDGALRAYWGGIFAGAAGWFKGCRAWWRCKIAPRRSPAIGPAARRRVDRARFLRDLGRVRREG